MSKNGTMPHRSRAPGRVLILLVASLVILGACLVVTQFGGDDASAFRSHMDPLDQQDSPIYTYGNGSVCTGLVMKADSSDAKGVSFVVNDIIYEVSGKDAVTVMGFAGYPASELVIPSKVTSPGDVEYTVVKIDKGAFKGLIPLESAIIPDTVVELGKNAFMGCLSLRNLTAPISLKCPQGSKDHAFGNVSLTGLVLTKGADGLQREDNDFWNLWKKSLEELVVERGIRSITTSFKDWKHLESVTLKDVESILEDQFRRCDNLVSVIAPKVRTVHDNAFMDCPKLNAVDLSSFESHTKGIFVHCPNLKTIVSEKLFIDNGQLFLILDDGNLSLIQQLDAYAEAIKIPIEVAPPSSGDRVVTEIGKEAFREHRNLQSVAIHDRVVKVGEHAFHDCKSLMFISIPIGIDCSYHTRNAAFEGVKPVALALTKGGYDPDRYMDNEFWNPWRGSLESLTLEEGITDFRTSFKARGLHSVCMSDVKTIHENQFKDCEELTLVYLTGVETIGKCAFKNCKSILFVDGSKTKDIGKEAFCGCDKMIEFVGGSVERIGEKAFYKCDILRSFNLDNTKEIGTKAFWNTHVSPGETISQIDAIKAFGRDSSYEVERFIKEWWFEIYSAICAAGFFTSLGLSIYFNSVANSVPAMIMNEMGELVFTPAFINATHSYSIASMLTLVFAYLWIVGFVVFLMLKYRK